MSKIRAQFSSVFTSSVALSVCNKINRQNDTNSLVSNKHTEERHGFERNWLGTDILHPYFKVVFTRPVKKSGLTINLFVVVVITAKYNIGHIS